MILKIEIENFYSIRDMVRIDFRAANLNTSAARRLKYNTIEWNGIQILKTIGLFGPNASGKSNIMKAINVCCQLILGSHNYNEGQKFDFVPFKFDGWNDKPSKFLIDFVCDNIEYEYSFSLTTSRILSESLFYYPNGRKAKVFVRDNGEYSFGTGVIPKPNDVALNTSDKNLFISRASSMNRELPKKIYRYFLNSFILGLNAVTNNDVILSNYENYRQLILHALEICDTDIADIMVKKEVSRVLKPDNPLGYIEAERLRFYTIHKYQNNVQFDLLTEESSGTQRLFNLLIFLLDSVRYGKSWMLDEFDTSLHIRLADFVLDLVHASENGQLLFSSHNVSLIDMERFRKDQIVFVSKSDQGFTEVYSLYDFKDFRENMDASKGYIQGRFDAVPYIDSSVENLRQLLKG